MFSGLAFRTLPFSGSTTRDDCCVCFATRGSSLRINGQASFRDLERVASETNVSAIPRKIGKGTHCLLSMLPPVYVLSVCLKQVLGCSALQRLRKE